MLILATTIEQVDQLLATARQIEHDAKTKSFAEQVVAFEQALYLRRLARLSLDAQDFAASVW